MKILDCYELMELSRGRKLRRPIDDITPEVESLLIGQALSVSRQEWPYDSEFSTTVTNKFRDSDIQIETRTLADGSGWIVHRIA